MPSIDVRLSSTSKSDYFYNNFEVYKSRTSTSLVDMDAKKLQNYLEINMAVGHKVNNKLSYHLIPFVDCKKTDFLDLHDTSFFEVIENRICPDFAKLKELWRLQGSYSNTIDRYHAHIEISMCNTETNPNCYPREMQTQLLNQIYFTITNVIGKPNLKNFTNPINVNEEFHSQFKLDPTQYRDNNNYMRLNKVETKDDRVWFWNPAKEHSFMDIGKEGPVWIGDVSVATRNVTYDGYNYVQRTHT